jgi:crotonobetainyl-CoA:carnitine CoA-transferase CaiB-like acyl-CoA transferase
MASTTDARTRPGAAASAPGRPLDGVRVVDFTTLLPGPLATLLLAEAGADVIKVERPPHGDAMRAYAPVIDGTSVIFALLNRGKRSLAADLSRDPDRGRVLDLIDGADILVEQFRPGVMARLGLDYDSLRARRPDLIYCSITGYGQHGPRSAEAGHDLNYLAAAGLLSLTAGADGMPAIPPVLAADVGAGSHPAVINILLALLHRQRCGQGCHIDMAMTDNLFALAPWALAQAAVSGQLRPGGELLSGGSPRYRVYRAADGRFLALAALEERFWQRFCELIELPRRFRDDTCPTAESAAAVAAIVSRRPASEWQAVMDGEDVCCNLVESLEDVIDEPRFAARGLFAGSVRLPNGDAVTALPLPLSPLFRAAPADAAPALEEGPLEWRHRRADSGGDG